MHPGCMVAYHRCLYLPLYMKNLCFYITGLLLLLLTGCTTDYANLPTYSGTKQLQAVIENPAGTSHRLRFDRETKEFSSEKVAGKDKVINFLPFPGNYGFIPSTEVGSSGDPLEVLVIAEAVETGTVMEVVAVGVLQLNINGELEPKVIAVPARPSEQLVHITDYATLSTQHPALKEILEKWFVHSTDRNARFAGWRDELFAENLIQRWMKL